jgi:GAF domain-containing protein
MVDFVAQFVARPLIGWWLTTSRKSWHRRVVANDSPHVHARGTNPDRVLITGDGAATGRGVATHDLGLPGYLARSLSVHTGRATDVDIVVTGNMTARTCLPAIADLDLGRFDIIVSSLGANEALALTGTNTWRTALAVLLDDIQAKSPAATKIFVLPIPFFGINPHFPPALARVVDRHVQKLNAVTEALVATMDQVEAIPVGQDHAYEPEGAHIYQRWAEGIALRISDFLDPTRIPAGNTEKVDEAQRQLAVEDLQRFHSGDDPVLDALAERARQALGAPIAAVTFVQSDVQVMKAASGIDPVALPRDEAFCDVTIRRAAHFVIEDATLDSRYAEYSIVRGDPGVRFYAGYPIEAPNGQRVGALCVMDTQPRTFTTHDAEMLRTLAHTIQTHLWGRRRD